VQQPVQTGLGCKGQFGRHWTETDREQDGATNHEEVRSAEKVQSGPLPLRWEKG